jgi:hypothetical protein
VAQALTRCKGFWPAAGGVERAAQRLAVDGDDLAGHGGAEGIEPLLNTGHESGGVETGEDAAERVVRGNAVGQVKELAEEVQLGLAKAFDIRPTVGVAQRGADGQDEEVEERVSFAAVETRVGKIDKERGKKFQSSGGRHPSPRGSSSDLRSILRGHLDDVNPAAE